MRFFPPSTNGKRQLLLLRSPGASTTTTASCGLPATIDPADECVTDANGFSTLDADSNPDIPMSLEISSKFATIDYRGLSHPATVGALSDTTASDGRYVLACKQAAGVKTVGLNVTRPANLTAFSVEWVQLFPKDSWENTTNEYEPFTFNESPAIALSVSSPYSCGTIIAETTAV